jgi:hypothetical protein
LVVSVFVRWNGLVCSRPVLKQVSVQVGRSSLLSLLCSSFSPRLSVIILSPPPPPSCACDFLKRVCSQTTLNQFFLGNDSCSLMCGRLRSVDASFLFSLFFFCAVAVCEVIPCIPASLLYPTVERTLTPGSSGAWNTHTQPHVPFLSSHSSPSSSALLRVSCPPFCFLALCPMLGTQFSTPEYMYSFPDAESVLVIRMSCSPLFFFFLVSLCVCCASDMSGSVSSCRIQWPSMLPQPADSFHRVRCPSAAFFHFHLLPPFSLAQAA